MTLWGHFRTALLTLLAMLGALACMRQLDQTASSAVLVAVLVMSLWRSRLDRTPRSRLTSVWVLPIIALCAAAVAHLLVHLPAAGAALFVAGLSLPIWLRRFGTTARSLGALMPLPLIAVLVTPPLPITRDAWLHLLLLPIAAALIAEFWVLLAHAAAWRLAWLPPPRTRPPRESASSSRLRPMPSTRMALQMAVALSAAFILGMFWLPEHWAWLVITAFLVNSGSRGRGDVAHKSVQRVGGAAIGTVIALAIHLHVPDPSLDVALILTAVFFGLWLRPLAYAWWALFITVALALVQGMNPEQPTLLLLQRLEAILIGALIGLASAWFVYPLRSTLVLRGRMAAALASLSDAIDPERAPPDVDLLLETFAELQPLQSTFRAWRRLSRGPQARRYCDWLSELQACAGPAAELIRQQRIPRGLRSDVGRARRALGQEEDLLPALQTVRQRLDACMQTP